MGFWRVWTAVPGTFYDGSARHFLQVFAMKTKSGWRLFKSM